MMRWLICAAAALVVALSSPAWPNDSPADYIVAAGKKTVAPIAQTVPIPRPRPASASPFQMTEQMPADPACRAKAPGSFNSLHEYTCAYQFFRAFSMPLADPAKRAEFDALWAPEKWKDSPELKMDGVSEDDRKANTFALIRRMRDFTHERFDFVHDPEQASNIQSQVRHPVLEGGIGAILKLNNMWEIQQSIFGNVKEDGISYEEYQKRLEAAALIGAGHELVVDAVVPDGPAYGVLKPGDIITEVVNETGSHPLTGISQSDAIKQIRGGLGTSVTLKVLRKNKAGRMIPLSFTLQRVQVQQRAVIVHDVDGVRNIRVENFTNDYVVLDFYNALAEAQKLGMKGITVDLRGNPGGRMDYVVAMLEMVIPRGLVLTVKQRTPGTDRIMQTEYSVADGYGIVSEKEVSEADSEKKLASYPRVLFNESYARAALRNPGFIYEHPLLPAISEDMQVAVLIDVGSYSASEIFAGAIKAAKRGVVVGQPSAGKGAIMTELPLPEGGGTAVTNGQFYPGGLDTKHKGVIPDSIVENARDYGKTDLQEEAAAAGIRDAAKRLEDVRALEVERTRINDQRFEDEMAKRDANDLKPAKEQDPRYQQ